MADASHLEKMGRELKCPICLSLLKSAASITCNHVFCNACILKSMKKESYCPVCKMPFHRREIRPAPNMDNLVGIYKSMETASGVNMFMSESAPSSQLPELLADASIHVQNDPQRCGSNLVQSSSFPSKKRVQVAKYPLLETPVHSAKIGSKKSECMPGEHQINLFAGKSNPDQSDRPRICLSPFFWLKDDEEDAEDLSQQSEGTFETDVTPPAALSFSDMKDSDYESPFKENTQGESHGKYPAVDLSDNDMLECTQRPGSPELCSMSTNFQIKYVQEKQPEVASQVRVTHESHPSVNADHLIISQGASLKIMQQLDAVDKKPKTQNPSKRKRNARTSQNTLKKSAVTPGTPLSVDGPLDIQDSVLKHNSNSIISEEKTAKRRKKSHKSETTATSAAAQKSILSAPTETSWKPTDKDVDVELANLCEKRNKCKPKNTSDRCLRSSKQKSEPSKIVEFGDLSEHDKNERNYKATSANFLDNCRKMTLRMQKGTSLNQPSKAEEKGDCIEGLLDVEDGPAVSPSIMVNGHLVSREKSGKHPSEINSSTEIRSLIKLKNSAVGLSGNASITLGAPSSYVQTARNVPGSSGEVTYNSAVQEKSQSLLPPTCLRKCDSNLRKIHCAFCQSAEDSKPYGKMIHYYDGRPVSTNHNEVSNLIHCHQICAEWAPNVYFKNDTAMNLKAELARSRRISCSCCGVKGAALGCYHKSCHKSFHVPCAKLMPECRWDSENYVMLCPLHASSKLPCEMPGSQKKRKRADENKSMQESVMTKGMPKSDWKGDSHRSPEKLVLCCSALEALDKDVVAQFKVLSGVRESSKWSSSVTHVIASVDENQACRRTLKVLMGILEGKWILSVKWIKACIDAKRLVYEQQYEITVDSHGIKGGPRLGRHRVLNKEPKLFYGLEFYLCGDFAASYKGYLQDLITAGGGSILHRKPIAAKQSKPSTFIIYNLEIPDHSNQDILLNKRISQANTLANSTGAKAASSAWILNSIAACQLQNTDE